MPSMARRRSHWLGRQRSSPVMAWICTTKELTNAGLLQAVRSRRTAVVLAVVVRGIFAVGARGVFAAGHAKGSNEQCKRSDDELQDGLPYLAEAASQSGTVVLVPNAP